MTGDSGRRSGPDGTGPEHGQSWVPEWAREPARRREPAGPGRKPGGDDDSAALDDLLTFGPPGGVPADAGPGATHPGAGRDAGQFGGAGQRGDPAGAGDGPDTTTPDGASPDGPSPDGPSPDAPAPDRRTRRRRRTRRVLYAALILLCAGTLLIAGTGYWAYRHYTGRVARIPNAFPTDVPAAAQPLPSKGGQTFLLVGVDARSDLPTTGKDAEAPEWKPGAQRGDTIMLVHFPADHKHAYVVSLPRDSWVNIPGHGTAKLNAAFSWGGPPLLIDTVQRLSRVKIDHLAVIDWSGFKKLTDAVGGVDLTVDRTVSRRNGPGGVWTAGPHHMNGDDALDYVRERYGLPRGDLDRTHRQQNFLRAVLAKTLSGGTFANPLKLKHTLDQVTAVVSVDDRLSDGDLRALVWNTRGVRSSGMVFMNAPVSGLDTIRKQSVVLLDPNGTSELWQALRNDTMEAYVATNTLDRLGDKVS